MQKYKLAKGQQVFFDISQNRESQVLREGETKELELTKNVEIAVHNRRLVEVTELPKVTEPKDEKVTK
jgi:hypothetical protein